MTIIEGQIETLKRIKKELNSKGITRFNSIADIKHFQKNYDSESNEIPKSVEIALDKEIEELTSRRNRLRKEFDETKILIENSALEKIKTFESALRNVSNRRSKNVFYRIFLYSKGRRLSSSITNVKKERDESILKRSQSTDQEIAKISHTLAYYSNCRETILSKRCDKPYKELAKTKNVVDGLYTLIAGAIGENQVVKEIEKLPDSYYLFNDFSVKFYPPIYNKKEKDKIYSIQIDHLLVCSAGIFILETKNWGKGAIGDIDLRSPVHQITRTSYALFVLLNSTSDKNKIKFDKHHWGDKVIPIRNLIVMINNKPKEEFKHVKIVTLDELNGYVQYFDPIFSSGEVEMICNFLRKINN
jgi:hypothetical protein